MFRFAYPFFLWGLAVLPVFGLLFAARMSWKRKAIKRFGDPALMEVLMPDRSQGKIRTKFFLLVGAWICLIIGLANPQIGSKYEEVKRQGVDLIIALDVSNSMLAEDIRPNRLERSKQAIIKLLDKLHDDRIGIVIFAGDAYLQLPFTNDYAAARMFLSTVSNESIQYQGTAIGAAIQMGVKSLPRGGIRNKAIIVISDGENHEDDALAEAKAAKEAGVIVHTLGIGTPDGSPIPEMRDGERIGFKTDDAGQTVISRMNPQMLQEIAQAGGGKFVQASGSDIGLEELFNQINSMQKSDFGTKAFTDYEDRFQNFLVLALMILLVEFLVDERRSAISRKMNLFGTKRKKQ
ncbi:MAG TPA: VWA domain-containing protein [Flavobacteriales bacterium]|nr:VWA domain-containing protein [Flavobacteriales bacterium]HPH82934.1 VWA domain-containing protein [Flavobacteriales bacterium]